MAESVNPVRLCCGQRHSGVVCPDNTVWCCICFGHFTIDELYEDSEGKWDMCRECGEREYA